MADNWTPADDGDDSEGMRSLRKAHEKAVKDNAELSSRLAEFEKRERARTIRDAIGDRKLNPKIANLIPSDLEVDKIDDWLGGYADVFGISQPDTGEPDHSAEQAAQKRLANAGESTGAMPGGDEEVLRRLADPSLTEQGLMDMIFAAQKADRRF